LRFDSGPPGFYLLAKPFALLADRLAEADALVRVPSWLAAAALFPFARTLPRGRARAVWIALVASSTLLNLYAGEARPYALLALLSLSLFLLASRGDETPGRLLALLAASAAALYTHYLAAFVVGALIAVSAASRRWRSCAALVAGAILWLPWLPVLVGQPRAATAWMRESAGASLGGFLSALGGVGRVPAPFGPPLPTALFFAGTGAGALLLALLFLRARGNREVRDALGFVLLVLAGAMLAGAWRPAAFAGRTEVAVLPVWVWAIARAEPESRVFRWVPTAAAGLGLLATAWFVVAPHPPATSVEIASNLSRVAGEGDVVVAGAGFYLPARLASERHRLAATVRSLPDDLARHPGWFIPALPGAEEERRLEAIMGEIRPGRRLFLVIPPVYATPRLRRMLDAPGGRARVLLRSRDALAILWAPAPQPEPLTGSSEPPPSASAPIAPDARAPSRP